MFVIPTGYGNYDPGSRAPQSENSATYLIHYIQANRQKFLKLQISWLKDILAIILLTNICAPYGVTKW